MNVYFIDLRPNVDPPTEEEIELVKIEIKNSDSKFIFFALDEDWSYDLINDKLKIYDLKFYQENCVVLVDNLLRDHHKINFYNVIRYDSQLIKVAIDEDFNQYNKEINLDTGKFLFLMGKPYKTHRIGALYKLYKNDLLPKCEYSFVLHENYYEKTREILRHISDDEFTDFVSKTQRKLDDIKITIGHDNYHYMGVPVNPSLYKNTSFSLISETLCIGNPRWFLSEKFWRTVASRHAFILMVDEFLIDYVHNLGFSTFQQFMQIDKNISGVNKHLIIDNSIKNVKFLLDNIQNNKEAIEFQIKKNYVRYRQLVEYSRNIVDIELEKYFYINDLYELPDNVPKYLAVRKVTPDENLKTAVKKLFGVI
jgi:hypothetical protein